MTKQQIALENAKRFINLPYKWGGNDPMEGFDCSGLMVEILKSVGIIGEKEDYTAHQLSKKFPETDLYEVGTMVYWDWDGDGKIDHVEMVVAIDDEGEIYTIGASGGNSTTAEASRASQMDAYVKVRTLRYGVKFANNPF